MNEHLTKCRLFKSRVKSYRKMIIFPFSKSRLDLGNKSPFNISFIQVRKFSSWMWYCKKKVLPPQLNPPAICLSHITSQTSVRRCVYLRNSLRVSHHNIPFSLFPTRWVFMKAFLSLLMISLFFFNLLNTPPSLGPNQRKSPWSRPCAKAANEGGC